MTAEGKRLFVGVRVSVSTANALAGAAETLARRARDAKVELKWVPPTDYHVTLRFFGWTREAAIGALRDALVEAAGQGPARLSFRTARLGAFPSLDRATTVWAGVEEPGELARLAGRIEAAAVGLGFAPERRAFHPHVTLARLRDGRPIKELVLPLAEQMFGETRIDAVILFESETRSTGSVHRELAKIVLGPAQTASISAPERQTAPVSVDARPRSHEPDTDDGWPRGQGGDPTPA